MPGMVTILTSAVVSNTLTGIRYPEGVVGTVALVAGATLASAGWDTEEAIARDPWSQNRHPPGFFQQQ